MSKFAVRMILLLLAMTAALAGIWYVHQRNLPQPEPPVVIGEPFPEDARVMLARVCSGGTCSPYKVSVSVDGKVEFEDQAFWINYLREARLLKTQVTQDQVKQLFAEFARANFFAIQPECGVREYWGMNAQSEGFKCGSCSAGQPTAITSITFNRKSRAIEHYSGCQGTETLTNLTDLEQRIDGILHTGQWLNRVSQLNRHGVGSY
jgi:hypothetical protein